jgi:hypothetical protein
MQLRVYFVLFTIGLVPSLSSAMEQFPVTARLFAGTMSADPKSVNDEMATEGLKKFKNIQMFGVEATYSTLPLLDVGFRFTRRMLKQTEEVDNPATDYMGELTQDSVAAVARIPFVHTAIVRADVFGTVGGTNTSFKIRSLTQDGEYTRKGSDGWFGAPVTSFGASVGAGYRGFYLVFEGGYESNKVKTLKQTGTLSGRVSEVDLSGGYFSVGLMFDGITATKK